MKDTDVGCLIVVLGIVAAIIWWGFGFRYSSWGLALSYGVDHANVEIQQEPHDCDFWKAPIGEKECHYKRVISVTEIGLAGNSHEPVISYDGGKTWNNYTPDPGTTVPQGATVTSVTVTWEKSLD